MDASTLRNISWTEYASRDRFPMISKENSEAISSRLCREDMKFYGLYPIQEELILVACNFCKKLVKIEALSNHYENSHNYTVRETLRTPSSCDYNSNEISLERRTNRKIPETAGLANKTDEPNVDRQCGVWMKDRKAKCRNSLNCKLHPISLRRNVKGRTKAFDRLLTEHKERIQSERASGTIESNLLIKQSGQPEETAAIKGVSENEFHLKNSGDEDSFDFRYRKFHPIPAAVCTFGARRLLPGTYIFNRRSDRLYTALVSAVNDFNFHNKS
ncbi:Ataxin-7 [Trichoplax sp. H2]|nr:Ataxin-7 [Trichoplax sp. H2]|eukprot:RDD47134.1 Ataxin-7 [Trichoplax sp. H2]